MECQCQENIRKDKTSNNERYESLVHSLLKYAWIEKAEQVERKMKCEQIIDILREFLPFMIDCNDDINAIKEDGQTILHVFIRKYLDRTENFSHDQLLRMQDFVKKLIVAGASPYVFDKDGRSPLQLSTMCKSVQILEVLISCLTDVNEADDNGNTALHIVADNCVDEETTQHKVGYMEIIQALVYKGADIKKRNKKKETAVHLAAGKFHAEMLEFFKNNGVELKQFMSENEIPLFCACNFLFKQRNICKVRETVDFLINECSDFEFVDRRGYMPLHYAAEFGTAQSVAKLIKRGANVDCRTEWLCTPLHLVFGTGGLDIVKTLVEAGADVDAETKDGVTPMFLCASFGSFESMLYLYEQGADLYRRYQLYGFSLLHFAAYEEQDGKKVNFLIEKGLEVNNPGLFGVTPLQLASLKGNLNNVKMLIKHGANVNFQGDKSNITALHCASIGNSLKIVETLVEASAEVNCRGGVEQRTPLDLILAHRFTWSLGRCRNNSTNGNRIFRKTLGLSAFKETSNLHYCDFVKILIKNGADVNAKDPYGRTPLHLALFRVDDNITKILLEAGAHPNVQDIRMVTPLFIALELQRIPIFTELLNFGADINDEDTSKKIMTSHEYLKNIAIKHAIKLKLLGLPIAKVYESSIQMPDLQGYRDQCFKEINILKEHRIGNFSHYNFLRMNPVRQYHLIKEISNSYGSLEKLFPLYFNIIRGACYEAATRRTLLESARIAWAQISNTLLPDVCVEVILSHLNNRCLGALVDSANPIEIMPIDERTLTLIGGSIIRK